MNDIDLINQTVIGANLLVAVTIAILYIILKLERDV